MAIQKLTERRLDEDFEQKLKSIDLIEDSKNK
jgi:hypothetical protein